MERRSVFGIDTILLACLALFFIVGGIIGIQGHGSTLSGFMRAIGRDDTLKFVVAMVELVVGILLALALIMRFPSPVGGFLSVAVPALFAVWVGFTWFDGNAIRQDFLGWLYGFVRDLVILVALWIASKRFGAVD